MPAKLGVGALAMSPGVGPDMQASPPVRRPWGEGAGRGAESACQFFVVDLAGVAGVDLDARRWHVQEDKGGRMVWLDDEVCEEMDRALADGVMGDSINAILRQMLRLPRGVFTHPAARSRGQGRKPQD